MKFIFEKTRNIHRTIRLLSILIILNVVGATGLIAKIKPTEIPIKEAIDKGMLKVKISGSYDPRVFYEILDRGNGMHYGKCMAIRLMSNLDSMVLLKLNAGTILVPTDDSVQKMLVTHDVLFPLYPRKSYWTSFYAMCSQIHNRTPTIFEAFSFGETADTNLVKLARYCEQSFNQNMPGQHAVWAYTDTVCFETLRKYGADSNSLKKSIEILNAVKMITPLNNSVNHEVNQNPIATITLNSYIVYGGIGAISILTFTTFIFLRMSNKNKKTAV